MQIHNIKAGQNKNISCKGAGMQLAQKMADPTRHALRTLSDLDALATTVVLEGFVTGGRGINAYKRGGKYEFRERFTDDVVSAVFWMKGVDIFNKIGDSIGKNLLKLPTTEFDVGKDALRTPFENLKSDVAKTIKDSKAAEAMSKKIAAFKFTKIVASSLLATAFVGFALPKINQAITERIMGRNKMEKKLDVKGNSLGDDIMNSYSFEAFDKKFTSNQAPSFKGLERAAHILENNRIAKLLTSDVGIITGRVTTARNKDEAREYFFRDSVSPFFYYASTPLIYMGLQKLTKSAGITGIDPVAAKTVHKTLSGIIENTGSLNVKDFAEKALGVLDDKSKEILKNISFNDSNVTTLKEFCKQVTDKELRKQAAQMSKLQPVQAGVGRVLTRQQVTDVLQKGAVHTPEFMNGIYKEKFGEALTNKLKFIPIKKILSFHNDIENYTQAVIKAANKTNNGIVDKNLLEAVNRKGLLMSTGFRTIAIGISALALGFIIPKMQYAMTARRTGSNAAPGLRNYEELQKN